jgi:hypothetical protein
MVLLKHNKLLPACLACLLLSLFLVPARAQDPLPSPAPGISPAKQTLVREMLDLASSKKTIEAMFKAQTDPMDRDLPETIWKALAGMKELQSLTSEEREEVHLKVVSGSLHPGRKMFEALQQKIDFNKLIEDISFPLYDKYFTESELRDLLVFYKSPTGKKVIEVMPNLLAESMTQTATAIMPRVTEIMTQIYEEETGRMEKEIQAIVKTREKPAKPTGRRNPQKRPKP